MGSTTSRRVKKRTALQPQRRHGRQRVAALFQAGAAVIAERGFEAATMAEIAQRAGAPIGSLYRFFPNKEILADALIQRFGEQIDEALRKVDSQLATLSVTGLTDALLGLLGDLRGEVMAVHALMEARSHWSAHQRVHRRLRWELRDAVRRHLVRTLRAYRPHLSRGTAEDIAYVVLQSMRAWWEVKEEQVGDVGPGVAEELREMTRLYLASKLARRPDPPKRPR
jgi:AcrR family transcriptional regulator